MLRIGTLFLAMFFFAFTSTFFSPPVHAATFSIKTGIYAGNGTSQSITGLGFTPNFVMIKSVTTAGAAVFKTSAMPANTTAFASATADNTGSVMSLDSDGFTIGTLANINNSNVLYHWVAVGGSDCSATGTFCVGTYTGNTTNPRTITVGFLPAFVIVKRSTAVAANFRVNSEPANEGLYLTNAARNTNGALFGSFSGSAFTVGTTNNANLGIYYYVAFKNTTAAMNEGTFTGDAADPRAFSGIGLQPNFLIVKNATGSTTTLRNPRMAFTHSYGDSASYIGSATANAVNAIQSFDADGFTLGSNGTVNNATDTFYWTALGGVQTPSTSGTYTFDAGSYTGTGSQFNITGLTFKPDLVIVKGEGTTQSGFRTNAMSGDITFYLATSTTFFTGGIMSLNTDGFTIGTNTVLNTSGQKYHWQAFGNGISPGAISGKATDFAIGTYYGNGITGRTINNLPFTPDLLVIRRHGASAPVWRSAAMTGDIAHYFSTTAAATGLITSIITNGFTLGTNNVSNAAANIYWWFAFKAGGNLAFDSYPGSGNDQTIGVGFQPDLVWVKRDITVNGVLRQLTVAGNGTLYFAGSALITNRITGLTPTGFSLTGTSTETNANGGLYYYAALGMLRKTLSTSGTQSATVNTPSTDNFMGGALQVSNNIQTVQLTQLRISETGTIDAAQYLSNLKAYYKQEANCSATLPGDATLFNSTAGTFNGSDQSTITGSIDVGTAPICIYLTYDVASSLMGGETVEFAISNPKADLTVSTGSIMPSDTIAMNGTTTVNAPAIISVTLTTDGIVNYGTLAAGASRSTIVSQLNDTQIAQNDGNGTETFNIKTSTATGGTTWSVGGTPGANTFVHEYSVNGGNNWFVLDAADVYETLATGIAPAATQSFDLRLTAPSSSSDFQEKSVTITIQAVQE